MTKPLDISRTDWAPVRGFAERILDGSRRKDKKARRAAQRDLFEYLSKLDRAYGPHPQLLSTRADFTDGDAARLRLLRRAYRLARATRRGDELVLISHSIGSIYAAQKRRALAVRWLWRMKQYVKRQSDPDGKWFVEDLEGEIRRIGQPRRRSAPVSSSPAPPAD